jgi:MFS family permease
MAFNEMISAKLTTIREKLDIFPYVNDAVVLGALIGLSYIGVALTRVSAHTAYLYWLIMIPAFGAISLLAQWQLMRAEREKRSLLLRRQLFHWSGLWVAVQLTYGLLGMGFLHYESVGFVVFLLLAFAFFLQGVYVDWRFYIVGGVLAVSLLVAMYLAAYIWIILLLVILFIAGGVWVWYIRIRAARRRASAQEGRPVFLDRGPAD